jgi:hypothetical protein
VADVRTMKLNLLADVSKFGRGLNDADKSARKFESKLKTNSIKMAKSIGLVTGAVGLMAIAFGKDAAKAYAEDEVSQKKFRKTLEKTAGVIDETVLESIDNFIEKMQFATGYSDVDLRDALGRLTRSTGDVTEAQDLLNISLDTARGTGKPLPGIVDALAKAYDGNLTPLRKLGIKLDDATGKTKSFKDLTTELSDLFEGQASTYADTYQGKLDIVNEKLGELKEASGKKLIDRMSKLLDITNDVADGFAGNDKNSLSERAQELSGQFKSTNGGYNLGSSLAELADAFGELFKSLNNDKDANDTLNSIAKALKNVADGINAVAKAYREAKKIGGKIADFLIIGDGGLKFADTTLGKKLGYKNRAAGGSVMGNQAYRVGEFGPEMFVPSGSGSIRADSGGQGVTIIMNGVIDGESARRSIERLLQDSSRRTGAINLVGATL